MTKMDKIINHLRSLGVHYFSITSIMTNGGRCVSNLYYVYGMDVFLTTDPKRKKYRNHDVVYYKDWQGGTLDYGLSVFKPNNKV